MHSDLTAWHPRPRLRRLQGLILRNLVVPIPARSSYDDDRSVSYQLYQLHDGSERLLYYSEEVAEQLNVVWDHIDWSRYPTELIHAPFEGQLRVVVSISPAQQAATHRRRVTPAAAGAAPPSLGNWRRLYPSSPNARLDQEQQQQPSPSATHRAGSSRHHKTPLTSLQEAHSPQQHDQQHPDSPSISHSNEPLTLPPQEHQPHSPSITPTSHHTHHPPLALYLRVDAQGHCTLDIYTADEPASLRISGTKHTAAQTHAIPAADPPAADSTAAAAAAAAAAGRASPDSLAGHSSSIYSSSQSIPVSGSTGGSTTVSSSASMAASSTEITAATPLAAAAAADDDEEEDVDIPGRVTVLDCCFNLEHLYPIADDEVHAAAGSGHANQLVLELADGCYVPAPPGSGAAAGAAAAPSAPARQLSLTHSSSGKLKRAAIFSWMLSGTSAVQPVSAAAGLVRSESEEEEDVQLPPASALGRLQLPDVSLRSLWTGLFGQMDAAAGAAAGVAQGQAQAVDAAASEPGERSYDVQDVRSETRRLTAAQERLAAAGRRLERVRQRVQDLLGGRQQRQWQAGQLQECQQRTHQLRQRASQQRAQLQQLQQQAMQRRHHLAARCAALHDAGSALSRCLGRLGDAQATLAGEEGSGLWRAVHARLVARQNRTVSELSALFQVGPSASALLQPSPLEERIDQGWWAAAPKPAGADGAAAGKGGEVAAAAGADSSGAQAAVRLSICGLELPPSLARRGLEGTMGWNGTYDEEQRVAAALGAMAHVVERLAWVLGIPLRYPLIPQVSRSLICDPAPPSAPQQQQQQKAQHQTASYRPQQQQQQHWRDHKQLQPTELPLYYDGGSDRTRFVYAIYLLNKDIEQLLAAHGLASAGSSSPLQNLYKLAVAAASAVPPRRSRGVVGAMVQQLEKGGSGGLANGQTKVGAGQVVVAKGQQGRPYSV